MKGWAGCVGVLVGLALMIGAGLYIVPRFRNSQSQVGASTRDLPGGAKTGLNGAPPRPDEPITTPSSQQKQLRDAIDRKRLPYYRFLHDNFSDVIERFAVLDDVETLDLVLSKSDEQTTTTVLQRAVSPAAKDYGFNRVRFYVQNQVGSVEPYRVIAEGTVDSVGRWNLFWK